MCIRDRFHQSAPAYAETFAEPVEQSPAIYVSEKNANSVVGILTNTQTWDNVNGVTDQTVAQGSGVVVAEGGYVLTNNHVIADGTAYQVLMPSGDKVDEMCRRDRVRLKPAGRRLPPRRRDAALRQFRDRRPSRAGGRDCRDRRPAAERLSLGGGRAGAGRVDVPSPDEAGCVRNANRGFTKKLRRFLT